ncbi:MAG: DUF4623 domain-containing protein [Planctomycetes bacterium]|nr:DUF4623 domain-containing protein [Planctomycetota bacterium]
MPRLSLALTCAVAAALAANHATAQSTITPLATFGTGGWVAPGSSAFVTTGNTERGLAYNPTTGNLVLVSRAGGNNIRILDGISGLDVGGLDATGITGGTFAINMAGVSDDGAIYVCNLSTSATSNFKIYKWDSEATGATTPPTVAYDAPSGMGRTGDAFAVTGNALANTVQFAGAGSAPSSANANSCFAIGTLDGTNTSTAYLSIPGTTTASNDYRLGLTFVDQGTVIGTQGGTARLTSFNGTTATVVDSLPLTPTSRAMSYAVIAGTPVLAVLESNSSQLSIYEVSTPSAPVLLLTANNTVTPVANANGTGAVAWGAVNGNSATLYAMNSNQGIQAFSVTIQPPASASPFGAGCGAPALSLSAVGAPVLPSTIQLQTDNLPPTVQIGGYVFGFTAIPGGIPLPFPGGCQQYVLPLSSVIVVTLGAPSYQLPQTYPNNPAYAGVVIFAQSVALDPAGSLLTSNALRLYLETF